MYKLTKKHLTKPLQQVTIHFDWKSKKIFLAFFTVVVLSFLELIHKSSGHISPEQILAWLLPFGENILVFEA